MKKILRTKKLLSIVLSLPAICLLGTQVQALSPPAGCIADYDKNGIVSISDLGVFASNYKKNSLTDCSVDVIGNDCYLGIADLSEFAKVYKVPNICINTVSNDSNPLNLPSNYPLPTIGYYSTFENQIIDHEGKPIHFSGINWFGAEDINTPDGLNLRSYKSMMDQMKSIGFDSIRITLSVQMFDAGEHHDTSINTTKNPDLVGLSGVEVLDKIVDYAGQIDMKIVPTIYSITKRTGNTPLWYDNNYSQQDFINTWKKIALRYKDKPAVIAADLKNEPHGTATWGTGETSTDWRLAATKAGNAILSVNPNMIILVEGINYGGNLRGVKTQPVTLNVPHKVVYSPHAYGYSVSNYSGHTGDGFENNLLAEWRTKWGYIYEQNLAPVLLGEFGSAFEISDDLKWLNKFDNYMAGDLDINGTIDIDPKRQPMSWMYWSWNPNSSDTGGIVKNDWVTLEQTKVDYLKRITSPIGKPNSMLGGKLLPTCTGADLFC